MKIGRDRIAGAGRSAVSLTRDSDWEDVVKGLMGLPKMAREIGVVPTVTWAQLELRSAIDVLDLAPDSPYHDALTAIVDEWFKDGALFVMVRSDQIGWEARSRAGQWVERLLRLTIREVFIRSPPDVEKRVMGGGSADRAEP
jgi:hypothetical protein